MTGPRWPIQSLILGIPMSAMLWIALFKFLGVL